MTDHSSQKLTTREMIRAHAYPILAALSTVALFAIGNSLNQIGRQLGPISKQAGYQNRCVEEWLAAMDETVKMKHFVAVSSCVGKGN